MKIAVSYENGQIFHHVGDTKTFKLYNVEENKVIDTKILETTGRGRGMVIDFLQENSATVLLCNEICSGAKGAVVDTGVQVFGGVTGDADEAVKAFLNNQLTDGDTVVCNHD